MRHGFSVTVNDHGPRNFQDASITDLETLGVTFVFGGHPPNLLERAFQFVVKNPGIPYGNPLVAMAIERNIPVFTEIEIASWFTASPIYAITGSNGKTTTTTLLGEMLKASDLAPAVAGNIGNVVSGLVEEHPANQPIVLEVSSFQLMGTWLFHPHIAALLNFYAAHLDYHGTFKAYQEAKWKLFVNLVKDDVAVLNRDQELIRRGAESLACDVHWFSGIDADFANGAGIVDGRVVLVRDGVNRTLMTVSEIALKGPHNLQNILAAAAMAQAAGVDDDAIEKVASSFQGVEHRMEFVASVNDIRYYNDSKATNMDASRQALRAFDDNVIWIAGGLDRGVAFDALVPDIERRVKIAIVLGETKGKLREACQIAHVPTMVSVETMEQAVEKAHELAVPGDVVLLSPACASWDMFTSFEVRGSMFKDAVHRL